jgi:hypothetical protein
VVVAAFGNEPEFWAGLQDVRAEISRRRDNGEPAGLRAHAPGTAYEPGYRRRAANGHLVTRAIGHGAARRWIMAREPPSNTALFRAGRPPAEGRLSPPPD